MGQCPIFINIIFPLLTYCCVLILLTGQVAGQGMKCSGYCTKDISKCQLRGGKVIGYCTKNLICCDPLVSATGSCGDRKSDQKVVFFKSPSFPEYAGGDLLCDFKVRIRNDTIAIRVDFLMVEMDGLSFDGGAENTASCESDVIYIRGFNTWSPPARCGNLTGYGVLIDMNTRQTRNLGVLSVIALMSSPKYRFHVRIAQMTKDLNIKHSSIEKRSVFPNTDTPTMAAPTPTKILIKTGRPAIFARHVDSSMSGSVIEEDGKSFKIFDSEYPPKWRSPSIVNGEDTLISTVPWQVSLRVKALPPSLPNNEDSQDSDYDSSTEDELTMENDTSVYQLANCSETEGMHFCGGSILDDRSIISAAHCFFGSSKIDGMLNISSIMVVVGDTNKCTDDEEEIGIFNDNDSTQRPRAFRYDVESVIFHYGYDHSLLINDLAVLRLNESIKYFGHVKPVTLARSGDNFEGHEAMISGFGDRFTEGNTNNFSSEEPQGPNVLQSSKHLEVQNRSFCNERDLSQFAAPKSLILTHSKYLYVFDSTICTLTKNGSKVEVNTGRGDSGGPLIVFVNNTNGTQEAVLVGVVSYSIPFDEKVEMFDGVNRTVDFYTSVAFFRGWIDLVMKSFQQFVKVLQ